MTIEDASSFVRLNNLYTSGWPNRIHVNVIGALHNTTAKSVRLDHSLRIDGNITNSQMGQSLTNCTNMIQQQAPSETKTLLETLRKDVEALLPKLPEDQREEAAGNLELMVKAATAATPNRKWYSVSAEGLLEASKFVQDFSGSIAGTIGNLGKALWPTAAPE